MKDSSVELAEGREGREPGRLQAFLDLSVDLDFDRFHVVFWYSRFEQPRSLGDHTVTRKPAFVLLFLNDSRLQSPASYPRAPGTGSISIAGRRANPLREPRRRR